MSTHADAVTQVRPAAVSIIGTAVRSPERAGEVTGQWVSDFLATAPATHRLALLDAYFQCAQTLTGAVQEIAPGLLGPIAEEVPAAADLPVQVSAGVRDGLRMLIDGGGTVQRRKWVGYATGAVSDERYLGAALALVGRCVDLVDVLVSLTGMPVRGVWSLVEPTLLD